jgi:hypothetical protein
MLIRSTGKLWSASSDGLVSIWDTTTLDQDSTITSHRATNVPVVLQVAAANSSKLWTVSADGKIRVWYNDTEPSANNEVEFSAVADMEMHLQTHVDACRKRIVHNYHQLERCKEDLLELERRDQIKKETLARVFDKIHNRSKASRAIHSVALAVQHDWQKKVYTTVISSRLAERSVCHLLRPFFYVWGTFVEKRRTAQRKQALKECVTQVSQNALTSQLMHRISLNARQQCIHSQLKVIASGKEKRNQLVLLERFFSNWTTFSFCSKLRAQQRALRNCPRNAAAFVCASSAWHKLRGAQVQVEGHQLLAATAQRQEASSNQHLMRMRFAVWRRLLNTTAQKKLAMLSAGVLEEENRRTTLAFFYARWATSRQRRALTHIKSVVAQQESTVEKLQTSVTKVGTGVTEADLEAELQRKQLELARLLEECRDLDRDAEAYHVEKRTLQRELLRDYSVDASLPVQEQLDKSMFFLKARGVNTYHDVLHLATARDDLRKMKPDAMIADGIAHIRRSLARYARPEKLKLKGEPDWYVGEVFQKIKRKGIERAAVGVCRIVSAFDALDKKQLSSWVSQENVKAWDPKHQFAAEVTGNLGALLEISLRAYRYHRGEDPLTGLPRTKLSKKVRKMFHDEGKTTTSAADGGKKNKKTLAKTTQLGAATGGVFFKSSVPSSVVLSPGGKRRLMRRTRKTGRGKKRLEAGKMTTETDDDGVISPLRTNIIVQETDLPEEQRRRCPTLTVVRSAASIEPAAAATPEQKQQNASSPLVDRLTPPERTPRRVGGIMSPDAGDAVEGDDGEWIDEHVAHQTDDGADQEDSPRRPNDEAPLDRSPGDQGTDGIASTAPSALSPPSKAYLLQEF